MNFGHRCACVISFILGLIVSMFLSHTFPFQSSFKVYKDPMCDTVKTLVNLKNSINELLSDPRYRDTRVTTTGSTILPDTSAEISDIVQDPPILNNPPGSAPYASYSTSVPTKKVRLLCWILTGPKNHQKKAIHVKETWGKRCDKLLFISTEYDASLPTTVVKGAKEGRNGLWSKTRGAFKMIYEQYLDEADFFLKADDDTYVIVENLKHFLADYESSQPLFFGCQFDLLDKKTNKTKVWDSGGAGYVLTRAAVKDMVEKGYKHTTCKRAMEGGAEDLNIARCLIAGNVTFVDTRDSLGRYRFHGYPARSHVGPSPLPKWWGQYIKYPQKSGMDCCSDYPISFHYISPQDLIAYEYFIYNVRVHGVRP